MKLSLARSGAHDENMAVFGQLSNRALSELEKLDIQSGSAAQAVQEHAS